MSKKRIAAGAFKLYYGLVDANGRFIGTTADGATAGNATGQPMLQLLGVRTLPSNIPDNEVVPVLGDDEVLTSFDFEAGTFPSGVIELAARDNSFEALVQGTKVHALNQWESGVLMPGSPSFPSVRFILNRRSKKFEGGVEGAKAWEVVYLPLLTITPKYTNAEMRAFTPYRYSYTAVKSAHNFIGATYTEGNNGTDLTAIEVIDSDNPIIAAAYKGNGVQQNFTLPATPVSGNTRLAVTVDDVLQTYTGHYTVSGTTLTFVSAPASGAIVNVTMEVAEENLP